MKQLDHPPYYPFRLEAIRERPLLERLFEVERWTAMERMLPVHRYGRLQQIREDQTVAAYSLWEEETLLGRDPLRCTIIIPKEYSKASRLHAVIRREPEGVVLEDMDSHNGTYLDGRRIDRKAGLHDGGVITLGGTGSSEKEPRYIFKQIEKSEEDVDTTEDGTRPQMLRKGIRTPGKPPPDGMDDSR